MEHFERDGLLAPKDSPVIGSDARKNEVPVNHKWIGYFCVITAGAYLLAIAIGVAYVLFGLVWLVGTE